MATLGQQGGMTGQVKMIEEANEKKQARIQGTASTQSFFTGIADRVTSVPQALTDVIPTANAINKPSTLVLEKKFGLKVCVAVLNACEFNQERRQWRYREIYIHSKLLLIDDGFFTLGSANLNQRSMAVDSEINLATNDPRHASALRKRIWSQLTESQFIEELKWTHQSRQSDG